jgi:hypothetical protein
LVWKTKKSVSKNDQDDGWNLSFSLWLKVHMSGLKFKQMGYSRALLDRHPSCTYMYCKCTMYIYLLAATCKQAYGMASLESWNPGILELLDSNL